MWTGSLFECQNKQIILRHMEFRNDLVSGECYSSNGAVITAQSIGQGEPDMNTNGVCYTSHLRLQNVTMSYNNKTIACLHNDGTEMVVHNVSINVITGALHKNLT